MAHALLVVEALVPLQEIVNILHPVLACMNSIDAWHGEGRHADLKKLVLVQEECLFAVE